MANELETLKATQIPDAALYSHLRLDPEYASEEDKATAKGIYAAAVAFVSEQCGIDGKYMDKHPDLAIAVLGITRSLYDDRSATTETAISMNPMVESILAIHDFNLI